MDPDKTDLSIVVPVYQGEESLDELAPGSLMYALKNMPDSS